MIRNKIIISTPTIPILQHACQCNKTRKRNTRHMDWKVRNKTVLEVMIVYIENSKGYIKINEFSWLQKKKKSQHIKINCL